MNDSERGTTGMGADGTTGSDTAMRSGTGSGTAMRTSTGVGTGSGTGVGTGTGTPAEPRR
ncbi:hypothetical protein ABT234_20030 [Streptomyces sp. NPDC001586]|uniref:hypothetical protein n=1 Tax=unclassified Streptomyces TaxID=2593676 RepID=UPI00332C08D7